MLHMVEIHVSVNTGVSEMHHLTYCFLIECCTTACWCISIIVTFYATSL